MTVSSNSRRREYQGNGVTKEFDGPMAYLASSIQVFLADASVSALVPPSDYQVSQLGRSNGTKLTMSTAPPLGKSLVILRTVPFEQQVDITNQGAFLPETLEKGYDQIVMQTQQLKDAVDRSLRFPDELSSAGLSTVLPAPQVGRPIVWNEQGTGLVNGDTTLTGDLLLRGSLADPSSGAALVAYRQIGGGAVSRSVMDKLRERVSIKDFGAIGDGWSHPLSERYSTLAAAQVDYPFAESLSDQIDWCAFIAARNSMMTGTEYQGGTIFVPKGRYKLNKQVQFEYISAVTNFFVVGDGSINTELDFSLSAPDQDGIVFNGGSLCGVSGIFLLRAGRHGLVLNKSTSSYVSLAKLSDIRVQNCGQDGVYSLQSYLIEVDGVFSVGNGNIGFNFAGNHTSIISNRMYAANNVSIGIRINGAVYIDVNGQSDGNLRGWQLSNIRGGILRAPGTESNRAAGISILTSDASATGVTWEYQNIEGLVIVGACQLRNNTAGPIGANANIEISTSNGRAAHVTLIGCVDNVVPGDPSMGFAGANGAINVTMIDCVSDGAVVKSGNVVVRNMSNAGRSAILQRASGPVGINSGVVATMTWDGFAPNENTLGATFSGNAIVIPAGVNAVRVSACVTWDGAVGGARYIAIMKNGSGYIGMPQQRTTSPGNYSLPMIVSSTKPVPVVAGDTFSLIVLHDQGGVVNISGTTGNANWLCVEAVS